MDYPTVHSLASVATDTVVTVINAARQKIGRATLDDLAETRSLLRPRLVTAKLVDDERVVSSSEKIIVHTIEKVWRVKNLQYFLKFLRYRCDGCMQSYHFEAVFSRPTPKYPIPQTTASVFFTVNVSLIHGSGKTPTVHFKLEGHHQENDMSRVKLVEDWLLGVMRMKQILYKSVEDINMF